MVFDEKQAEKNFKEFNASESVRLDMEIAVSEGQLAATQAMSKMQISLSEEVINKASERITTFIAGLESDLTETQGSYG